jgi:SnoaL-like polyketide cyclase
MSAAENVSLVRKGFEAAAAGDFKTLAGLRAGMVKHNLSRNGMTVDGSLSAAESVAAGANESAVKVAAGAKIEIHEVFGSGDLVCTRWSYTVSAADVPNAIPGRSARVTAISINRVENGKVVEGWTEHDVAGMLLSLGLPVGK